MLVKNAPFTPLSWILVGKVSECCGGPDPSLGFGALLGHHKGQRMIDRIVRGAPNSGTLQAAASQETAVRFRCHMGWW